MYVGLYLELGESLDPCWRGSEKPKEAGAQEGHPIQCLCNVVGSLLARPDALHRAALSLQLLRHLLWVQLLEGVSIVEEDDQHYISLQKETSSAGFHSAGLSHYPKLAKIQGSNCNNNMWDQGSSAGDVSMSGLALQQARKEASRTSRLVMVTLV